jgi:outer membrane protein OmpA-like peptidoglycan-associated protein
MAIQPPQNAKSSIVWIGALGLVLVALGSFWLWSHTHETQLGLATGVASRLAEVASSLAEEAKPTLESAPQFASTSDTNGRPLSLDSLNFASGSSKLPTDASARLDQIAAMLKADPDLHLTIAGFTDDVGSAGEKLRISQSRADSVKNALAAKGIARIVSRRKGSGIKTQSPTMPPWKGGRRTGASP